MRRNIALALLCAVDLLSRAYAQAILDLDEDTLPTQEQMAVFFEVQQAIYANAGARGNGKM